MQPNKENTLPTFTRSLVKIEADDANGLTAVVNTAHWRCVYDDDETVSAYGTVRLNDPDPDNFTAFAVVTEAQAIGWLDDMGHWDEVETNLADQYAAKLASTATSRTF
jgi:hypothetical protein